MEERKAWLVRRAEELFRALPGNAVTLPGGETLALYEPPLMGFAAAGDGYLAACRSPEVVGPQFWTPEEWLSGAGTVVSLFLPFTREVRESNRAAVNLYRSAGFREIGRRRGYYHNPPEDAILMELHLV